MLQFSAEGTPVEIEVLSGHLLFIDPLYVQNIKDDYDLINSITADVLSPKFIQQLEEVYFPDGGGTLLGYLNTGKTNPTFKLNIESILYHYPRNEEKELLSFQKLITGFSSDMGSFFLIDLINFFPLLKTFDVEDIIDYFESDFQDYIDKTNATLGNKGWAYIVNPGLGNGFEFEGSGSFFVSG